MSADSRWPALPNDHCRYRPAVTVEHESPDDTGRQNADFNMMTKESQ